MADISIIIRAQTQKATAALTTFRQRIANVGKSIVGLTKNLLKNKLSWAALSVAVVKATMDYAQFELQMVNVANLTNATTEQLKGMTDAVLDITKRVPVSASDLAEALFDVQSAGIAAGDSIVFLEKSAKLARAGLTSTRVAVNGLTSVMNAYGVAVEDTSKISDIFFAAQVEGKTTIEELAQNIGRLAPVARASGLSVEEMFAAVTTLTKGGIKTDEAVVALRGAINSIISPTQEASDLAKQLGINLSATGIQTEGLVGVLKDLQQNTGGNITLMARMIPNVRALTGVLSLAGEQYDEFVRISGTLDEALGNTEKAFERTNETIDAEIKKAQNTLSRWSKFVVAQFASRLNVITDAIELWADVLGFTKEEIKETTDATNKLTEAEQKRIEQQLEQIRLQEELERNQAITKQNELKNLEESLLANQEYAEDLTAIMTANEEEQSQIVGNIIRKRLIAMIDAYVAAEVLKLQAAAPATFGASLAGIAPILTAATVAKGALQGIQFADGGVVKATQGGQTGDINGVNSMVAENRSDEAIIPLEDDARIKELMGGGQTVVNLVVDGQKLAQAVVNGYNKGRNLNTVTKIKER